MRIETERLTIRSFNVGDIPQYAEIVSDPRVTRFLREGRPIPYADAAAYVEDCIERDATTGVSRYAVLLGDELIGFCGYKEMSGSVDFGWRYSFPHWGRGYATEAARAVLEHGLETLQLRRISAVSHEENDASVRVIKKLGFDYVRRTVGDLGVLLWYELVVGDESS